MGKIINKNSIFTFMLGMIVASVGVYGTNVYQSNTIEYSPTDSSWSVSNVSDAINSLYSMKQELDNLKGIGDATAAQILSGKNAVVKGSTIIGTMTDRGAWTNTPTGSGKVTIPAGYHNGSGYVNTATSYTNGYNAGVSATKVGNATAAQVLAGKTFTNSSGAGLTGTMTNRGAWTNTPTTKGKVTIPAGYHNGNGYVDTSAVSIGSASIVHTNSNLEDGTLSGSYVTGSSGIYLITMTGSGTVVYNLSVAFSGTSNIIYDHTIGKTNGTTMGMGASRNVIVKLNANVIINYTLEVKGWASQFIQIAKLG